MPEARVVRRRSSLILVRRAHRVIVLSAARKSRFSYLTLARPPRRF